VLADGSRRTFNIERPDVGHPFTEDMDGLRMVDGEPTDGSLLAGLQHALSNVPY
jgi:hypothetical protein